MTEPQTQPAPPEPTPTSNPEVAGSEERESRSLKLMIGLIVLAVIVVIAAGISLYAAIRGGDEPLANFDQTPQTAVVDQGLFENEPVFDKFHRVVYIPKDPRGVLLPQQTPPRGRSATDAPMGVRLERIGGRMDVPFSTSDGPTSFTSNGIATGYSRTPQGAALAAAQYLGYWALGPSSFQDLTDAGLATDPNRAAVALMKYSRARTDSTYQPPQRVKVQFQPDLTLVQLGGSAQDQDGSIRNVTFSVPLVWDEGTGWVLNGDQFTAGFVSSFEGFPTWW